jgi:tetratricopeptide (TPR) repeat protein
MSPNQTNGKALSLQLVDEDDATSAAPTAVGGADGGKGRDLRITTADEFLAAAAQEYEKGQVDPALWARSTAQSGGDESLAIAAYLRARATALQLARREERVDNPAREASKPAVEARAAGAPKAEARKPRAAPRSRIDPRLLYGGAAVAGLVIVFAAWLLLSTRQDDAPTTLAAASSALIPQPAQTKPAAPVAAQPTPPAEPSFDVKIAELQKARNWNVMALYAVEWTRKQPGNPAAWNALSIGYGNLRQYDEALDAANKAVALAPADANVLRNLGRQNLAVDRWPEAGAAFDRVLAVASNDVGALCGAAEVAHKQARPRDAEELLRRVSAANGQCEMPADRPAFAPSSATNRSQGRFN